MAVKCISAAAKADIIALYRSKALSQREIAKNYAISERTIHRIIVEAGLATPVARIKGEAYNVMKLLKSYNMGLKELAAMLAAPQLTPEAVQQYLNQRTTKELAQLFFNAGMAKLRENDQTPGGLPEFRPIPTVNQTPLLLAPLPHAARPQPAGHA